METYLLIEQTTDVYVYACNANVLLKSEDGEKLKVRHTFATTTTTTTKTTDEEG